MSAGDILNPKRARTQANERLDTVDADALSQAPRSHLDAFGRAMAAAPRNVGSSTPVGLIWQGFGLTLNPTGPSDNKVRVLAPTGVAFDSDGRMLIKENGVTTDLTLPVGTSQIYAYYVEDAGDSAPRRFISVSSPYVESPSAIATTLKGDVAYYTRLGDQTSIVASDVVNGKTTALCFLGVATNAAGVITMTGYDPVTAPNGAYATNRLTAVTAPSTPPTTDTMNGSVTALQDLVTAALYTLGQTAWKGSDFLTPAAGNNFGAYNIPAGGVDKAFRQALGYVTIGNGTTVFGDFNTSDYANSKLLLDAAIASLPTAGGRIYLKRGVALTNFAGLTVTMPASKTVEIIGDHNEVPTTSPQLQFSTSEKLICNATGKLILRNLHMRQSAAGGGTIVALTTAPCELYDVYIDNTGTNNNANDAAMLQGTTVTDLRLERVHYNTTAIPNSVFNAKGLLYISGTAYRCFLKNVRGTNTGGDGSGLLQFDDIRSDVVMDDIIWDQTGSIGAAGITIASQNNTTDIRNRHLYRYAAKGEYALVFSDACPYLHIEEMSDFTSAGITGNLTSGLTGPLRFIDCRIGTISNWSGSQDDLQFLGCRFYGITISIGTTPDFHNKIKFSKCSFYGQNFASILITGESVNRLDVEENYFTGYGNPNSAPIMFEFQGGATNSNWIRVVRNRVDGFQNVAWTGGNVRCFLFAFRVQSANLIECSGNICTGLLEATSGNTMGNAHLLYVDTNDGTDTSAGSTTIRMYDNLVGNQVGSSAGNCGLLYMAHMIWDQLDIRRNQMWAEWNTAAGTPQAAIGFGVYAQYNATYNGTGKRGFIFEDNNIRIQNTAVADISKDLIFLQAIGVPTFQLFSFQRNSITMDQNRRWDQATAWGCTMTGWQALTTMVCENYTCRDNSNAPGGAGTPFFAIEQGVGAYFYTPTHAPPPAVNSPWDSNCFIWRGPN